VPPDERGHQNDGLMVCWHPSHKRQIAAQFLPSGPGTAAPLVVRKWEVD
jgi:hypothetical protein